MVLKVGDQLLSVLGLLMVLVNCFLALVAELVLEVLVGFGGLIVLVLHGFENTLLLPGPLLRLLLQLLARHLLKVKPLLHQRNFLLELLDALRTHLLSLSHHLLLPLLALLILGHQGLVALYLQEPVLLKTLNQQHVLLTSALSLAQLLHQRLSLLVEALNF